MNLYKVNVNRQSKKYYVLADDPNEAYQKVREKLDEWDWRFECERELESVELLAAEYKYSNTKGVLFR